MRQSFPHKLKVMLFLTLIFHLTSLSGALCGCFVFSDRNRSIFTVTQPAGHLSHPTEIAPFSRPTLILGDAELESTVCCGNVGEEYSSLLGPDTYLLPTSSLQILCKLLPSLHTFGYVFAAKYLHWTVKPFEKSTLWLISSFFHCSRDWRCLK